MQAELSPQPGQLVGGKYRILRVLGQGAMGLVFEAQHVSTGKRVAIKWLHPHVMESRSAVERLVREAQASARVRHSNVVDIYDVERDGDTLFLVMEFLDGEPLSALLERGGVPIDELLTLIVQAMRGVAEAHRQGVIHRDIKPDNIFLAYEPDQALPVAKVVDFGISKLDAPDGLSLTQTGSALGTPLYMSYEQLSGARDVDARSDVYGFGVILYEALTGTLPYVADNFAELAAKVITTDPVQPRALQPGIPERLEQIVMWAIRKRREERAPNLGVLIDALLPFTSLREVRTPSGAHALSGRGAAQLSVSRVSSSPSVPAASARTSVRAPAAAPDEYSDWNAVLDRSQRSRREMEDRVTALIAGTMSDYVPKKRAHGRGLWMALGAAVVLLGGFAILSRYRTDLNPLQASTAVPVAAHAPRQEPPVPPATPREPVAPAPRTASEVLPATLSQPSAEPVPSIEPIQVQPSTVDTVVAIAPEPSTAPPSVPSAAGVRSQPITSGVARAGSPGWGGRRGAGRGTALPRYEGPSGELVAAEQRSDVAAAHAESAIEPTTERAPSSAARVEPAAPPEGVPPSPYESDPEGYEQAPTHRAGSPQPDEF